MISFKEFLSEVFDKPLKSTGIFKHRYGYSLALFYLLDKQKTFVFSADPIYENSGNYEITFVRYDYIPEVEKESDLYIQDDNILRELRLNSTSTMDLMSDLGTDAIKVISTIANLIVEFVSINKPKSFYFSSKIKESSRTKLYNTLANKLSKKFPEYELNSYDDDDDDENYYDDDDDSSSYRVNNYYVDSSKFRHWFFF